MTKHVVIRSEGGENENDLYLLCRMKDDSIDLSTDEICRSDNSREIREIQEFYRLRDQLKTKKKI